jgi:hypothetical protein
MTVKTTTPSSAAKKIAAGHTGKRAGGGAGAPSARTTRAVGGDTEYDRELAALAAITPESHPARDAAGFRRINAARQQLAAAEAELLDAIRAARVGGDSWNVIGAALGQSRQAAHRRWAHAIGEVVVTPKPSVKRTSAAAALSSTGRSAQLRRAK